MNKHQLYDAIISLVGFVGILFVSMVPPMRIPESQMNCRFHFMAKRAWPFSSAYSVRYPDVQAMLSEWGMIIAACGILLSLGYVVAACAKRPAA